NLCHAIALLEEAGVSAIDAIALDGVRDALVKPSRDLIAGFHEGRSNRQVWNEVAILSASRVLGDDAAITNRLDSDRGLFDLFANGLLDDGTWYEGENYHLFAHRGLWYGVQLLRALNRPLPDALESRYRAGFVTPFLGVLPDDTLPSRRDSQYKVSIRQWRFAEWCELGNAHSLQQPKARVDERLVGTLHRLYNADESLALEPQLRHAYSTADAERNEPAGSLSRADLSWRALLMASPELVAGSAWSPASVCLPRQGLAVLRRERGDMYIALEGGHTGGGHGHPDRLALTLQHKHSRWLEDPGTGSYVDPSLHWYRSTLAHAAPLIDGASQDAVPAKLLAFEDRGGAGWICKRVENVKPGVNMQRTVVAGEGCVIDLLEWDADREVQIDLPIARNVAGVTIGRWMDADARGAGGLEDGFNFLTDVQQSKGQMNEDKLPYFDLDHPLLIQHLGDPPCVALYTATGDFSLWRAIAPGSPGAEPAHIHWIRAHGTSGRIAGVWSWSNERPEISIHGNREFPEFRVGYNQTESVHTRTPEGWHIALKARHATSSIDLAYLPTEIGADDNKPSGNSDTDSITVSASKSV
ncbi:MAG: heparinase II/III family protein, partial [Gemmatimonadaceae bacterium]